MTNPSALEMFMTPEQREALRALKQATSTIKAQIVIHGDSVEIKLVAGNAQAAPYLPQIGEHVASAVGQTLHYMFGITGEIVKRT
jgi:hypothetical protein